MKTIRTGWLILALLPAAGYAADNVILEGETPDQKLTELKVNAEVGRINVTAGDAGTVRWRIELEPDAGWFTSEKALREKLRRTNVHQETNEGVLHLSLDYPDDLDHDDCKQHWYVEVPAAFTVNATLGVGAMELKGIAGGIVAHNGVGQIMIDVPAGSVKADVGVGEIKVTSATASPGAVEVHAGVGDARARIGDDELPVQRAMVKADITRAGDGDDDYILSTGVGDASLQIKR